MPGPTVIVRKKKAPVIVAKKESPLPPKKKKSHPGPEQGKPSQRGNLKPEPEKISVPEKAKQIPNSPKRSEPIILGKARHHLDYLKEIESMPSPDRDIARACYFLCFLLNENHTTTTLFPLKDKVLEKISQSGHDCLMVSYIRRWDRLNYRLTPEAKEKWEAETGGKKALAYLYRTRRCYVEAERGYYDLYQFHIVVEPFRFLFLMPQELASWVEEERIAKPRLHTNHVIECGLCRGRQIKMSRKATGLTDEQIGAELQRFLDTPLPKISSEREDVTEGSVEGTSPRG